MTIQEQRSVTTDAPTTTETGALSNRTVTSRRLDVRPSNNETTRRILVLVFGLIQIVLGLRILLEALDARTGNLLVSIVINLGGVLAAPFQGILRISAVASGGSVLDVAAASFASRRASPNPDPPGRSGLHPCSDRGGGA